MSAGLSFVFLGLSVTSSWGNGHATTYRALLRELAARGHRVTFLERRAPWYQENADLPAPPFCDTLLYSSVADLQRLAHRAIERADAVILGSYVQEGSRLARYLAESARGIRAFYDIDTPVTLRALAADDCTYLARADVPSFDLYLSFSGGPSLRHLEEELGARWAAPLYCSVDPALYYPRSGRTDYQLGYLGTYSPDRQDSVQRLLVEPALQRPGERFIVAGPQYPKSIAWPSNVERREHVPPGEHRDFYGAQRATLNVTRRDMIEAGFSPSVRLFEAAACGTPIISDVWPGIETFFVPGEELLLAEDGEDVLRHLAALTDERRASLSGRARQRVLREHTAAHRAAELEALIVEARQRRRSRAPRLVGASLGGEES